MSCVKFAWPMLMATMLVVAADARAAGWVPRPGIEVSGSYGTVSRDPEGSGPDVPDAPYGGGWSVGATAEWMFAPSWALVSGLRYLETSQSETFTITGSGTGGPFTVRGDVHDTWHWLAVPLRAKVTPWSLPLSLEAGPEVQVLLVAKSDQHLDDGAQALRTGGASPMIRSAPTANIFEDAGTFGGDRDVTDLYHPVNFVLGGGVSFAWPARSGRIVAHARCGFGLNDLMKSDTMVRRTRSMEAGVGWQW
jgi:hypothetical protein